MSSVRKLSVLKLTNDNIVRLMTTVLFYFSIPLSVLSLARIPETGFIPVMLLHILLVIVLSISYFLRKKISSKIKIYTILGVFYFIGIGGVPTHNLIIYSIPAFFISIVFASVLLSRREAHMLQIIEFLTQLIYIFFILDDVKIAQALVEILSYTLIFSYYIIWGLSRLKSKFSEVIEDLESKEQKLNRALKVKSQFLALMSHEIRTPITSIILASEQLSECDLKSEEMKLANIVNDSTQCLGIIINDILDFSKIEAKEFVIVKRKMNLMTLLGRIEESYMLIAKSKNITFKVNIEEPSHYFLSDEFRLEQILRNLLNNAFKFTEFGEVVLNIYEDKKLGMTFEVQDTGIGIKSEKLNTLFEEFQQEEDDTAIKYGGTGLGLSIVKRIVNLLDGSIAVESEQKIGTNFIVKIPMKKEDVLDLQKNAKLFEEKSLEPRLIKGKRILIVEDNDVNIYLLKKILETVGFSDISIAKNGKIAIDILKEHIVDIIFMDIRMPVMNGIEATKHIRDGSAGDKNQKTKIVGFSANAFQEDISEGLDAGMDEYLMKPVRKSELISCLNDLLTAE